MIVDAAVVSTAAGLVVHSKTPSSLWRICQRTYGSMEIEAGTLLFSSYPHLVEVNTRKTCLNCLIAIRFNITQMLVVGMDRSHSFTKLFVNVSTLR